MEMKIMNTTHEAMIEKIEQSYSDIVRLYRSVPVTSVIENSLPNGWSVKDVLAHLAAWEWRCASLLEASHGTDGPLQADPDVAALNREIYEERKEWGWEEVEYDFRMAHQTLLKAIHQLPVNRLKSKAVQETIAAETWEHYAEHLPDLQRWHQQVTRNRQI
jgi:hypothetical protein